MTELDSGMDIPTVMVFPKYLKPVINANGGSFQYMGVYTSVARIMLVWLNN